MKIFIGIILMLSVLFLTGRLLQGTHAPVATESVTVLVTETPTNTVTRIPTKIPIVKANVIISPTSSPTPAQQIGNDLNNVMNSYRTANGRSTLLTNGDLCRIATTRVEQQVQAGSLDNHAGFQGEAASQKEFLHVGEILQFETPPQSNQYLVYTGWGKSAEHNAIMLDPNWTHGCGATSGPFAVFIFAR